MGNSPPGETYNEVGEGVPLVNGPVEFSTGAFGLTVKTKFTTQPTKMCRKGDFLICVRGSTTGRTNISAFDACIGRGVASIRAKEHQQYLNHFVRTLEKKIHAAGTGSTFPSISQEQLNDLIVPVPIQLSEQKRIAVILDRAEALRAKRRAALALLDELTQSIFLDMFGDAEVQSSKWSAQKIAEYVAEFQGGKSLESTDDDSSQRRVLKVNAVTGMKFRPDESKPIDDDYEPSDDHYVRNGDLLFSRANTTELVGAVAYVTKCPPNLLLPDKLWRFVWKDKKAVHPLFIWYLFQTRPVRREIENRATGSGGSMKNISKAKLSENP